MYLGTASVSQEVPNTPPDPLGLKISQESHKKAYRAPELGTARKKILIIRFLEGGWCPQTKIDPACT